MADLAKGKLGQGFHNFECIQSSTADINSVDCVSVFRLLLGGRISAIWKATLAGNWMMLCAAV